MGSGAFKAGQPLYEIETDKTKLRQNLFNLLSNAAKFTHSGTITLGARRLPAADGRTDQLSRRRESVSRARPAPGRG